MGFPEFTKTKPKETTPEYQEQKLEAFWAVDCQGKKDYDTNIISFSCRMYPPRYNGKLYTAYCHLYLRNGQGEGFFENSQSEIREYKEGKYFTLSETMFESETENECKKLVENWCNNGYNHLIKYMTNMFGQASGFEAYAKVEFR